MASPLAGRARVSPTVRGALLRYVLLIAGASGIAGGGMILLLIGLALPAAAPPLPAGAVLVVLGGGLAILGGAGATLGINRLRRTWDALDSAIDEISRATEANLIPRDMRLPDDSPLAPLAGSLTRMGQSVRQLVTQLQMQADQVRDIAMQIGRAAERHNGDAAAQAAAVSEVATAMTQLEAITARVTYTAREVSAAAEEVLEASTSSREAVESAITFLGASRQHVSDTLAAIEALRTRVGEIGTISDLISQIADQTHVLALNAAIEAADGHESRQRFAVVADEVRDLALRTREGSGQVRALVAELEQAMATTIDAANAGLEQTAHTAVLTTTLTSTAAELMVTAERTQHLSATIDAAMFQQGNSAAEVSLAITDIAEAAQGMRTQTLVMATEASELIDVSRQLRNSAMRFGVGTEPGHLLRLLMSGRETISNRGLAWRALVDAWNREHPGQSIALQFVPPADYPADLQRALAAGTAAEIVEVTNGTHLARYGYLAPLDNLLSPSVQSDFYPALLDAGRYEGRIYSLPIEAQPLIIFYNKRLFADLGMTVPRTWDEWLSAAERCQSDTRWGLVLETAPGDFRSKQWLPFVWQGRGTLGDDPGTLGLDAPPAQAALGLWRDLIARRAVVPRPPPHPVHDIANLVEGHCAMQYTGAWALTALRERYPDFAYGVMDLPIPAGGQAATALLRWGLAVNARSPHREVALAFVRWALAESDPGSVARMRSLMVEGLPVRRSTGRQAEQSRDVDPNWRYLLEQVYPHARPGPDWSPASAAAITHALDEAINAGH